MHGPNQLHEARQGKRLQNQAGQEYEAREQRGGSSAVRVAQAQHLYNRLQQRSARAALNAPGRKRVLGAVRIDAQGSPHEFPKRT